MAFEKLTFLPGIYSESTPLDASNRFIDGNLVRFYKGFPQTVGGWTRITFNVFLGVCRGLNQWVALDSTQYAGLGTNLKLYVFEGGTYNDITPFYATGTLGTNPFTTTIGSPSVTVTDMVNPQAVGNYVIFSGATTVGGLDLNGEFTVTTVVNDTTYTITASMNASSSTTGGGSSVAYSYEIPIGLVDTIAVGGWGAGPWGAEAWGTPRSSSNIYQYARTWTLGNYGEDLLASYRDGGIYQWVASTGLGVRAAIVANAPLTNKNIMVWAENRFVFSLGAYDGIESNPMLVRWNSENDLTDWTPTTLNTAGDFQLSTGNEIMCGVIMQGQALISTDTAIYGMFPDSQFVFDFRVLSGNGTGCISPNGMTQTNGVVFWVSTNDFYIYDGTVRVLPCDVRSFVFNNLNTQQAYKIYAYINTSFNEVIWLMPLFGSLENNYYVAINYTDGTCHYGLMARTAGIDKGAVLTNPSLTDPNGVFYAHESGIDADGLAMNAYIQTGNVQLANRNAFVYLKQVLPYFKFITGVVNLSVITQDTPQDPAPTTNGPYPITATTERVNLRARGDEVALLYQGNGTGVSFNIGTPQVEILPSGVR